jgi:molecular chaperone GrpE
MTEPTQADPGTPSPAPATETPEARIAALEAQLGEARAEHLRLLAEMDNQRKRMAREAESARRFANERLLGDLLPVVDGLEAGLKVQAADAGKLREGMEMTLRLLEKAIAGSGATAVDPAGAAFDPAMHQAMSMVDAPGHAPGAVVTVFQKGYVLGERLLRPAMVAVARDPA